MCSDNIVGEKKTTTNDVYLCQSPTPPNFKVLISVKRPKEKKNKDHKKTNKSRKKATRHTQKNTYKRKNPPKQGLKTNGE